VQNEGGVGNISESVREGISGKTVCLKGWAHFSPGLSVPTPTKCISGITIHAQHSTELPEQTRSSVLDRKHCALGKVTDPLPFFVCGSGFFNKRFYADPVFDTRLRILFIFGADTVF